MTELVAIKDIPSTVQILAGQKFIEPDPEKAAYWVKTDFARRIDGPNSRGWNGLNWDGATVVILASGESLSQEQADAVKVWRSRDSARKVIVINTTFRRGLWADVLYACDLPWWEGRDRADQPMYVDEAKASFAGELWTQDDAAAKKYGLKHIRSDFGKGFSLKPGIIRQGANGGYQAIGLAYQSGATQVYLLGYDMRGGHWHGKHPGGLDKNNRFDVFLKNFDGMAADVAALPDFKVTNCTPRSSLKCFPMADWQEVFV